MSQQNPQELSTESGTGYRRGAKPRNKSSGGTGRMIGMNLMVAVLIAGLALAGFAIAGAANAQQTPSATITISGSVPVSCTFGSVPDSISLGSLVSAISSAVTAAYEASCNRPLEVTFSSLNADGRLLCGTDDYCLANGAADDGSGNWSANETLAYSVSSDPATRSASDVVDDGAR